MSKLTVISETNLGLYVWQLPNGGYVQDDDGNVMNIVAKRGDIQAMTKLQEAARYYGFQDGKPFFMEGSRRVNDEELQEQYNRQREGLIPDPLDIGNYKEEMAKRRR